MKRYNYRANVDMNITKTTVLKVSVGGWLVNRTTPTRSTGDIWEDFAKFTPLSTPRKCLQDNGREWMGKILLNII